MSTARALRLALLASTLAVFIGAPISSAAGSAASKPDSARTGTFLGPDGVESRSIIAQNSLRGTREWEITAHPGPGFIEGFANENYAKVDNDVGLYISTSAPSFRVIAYRMGWYQGKGGHEVWSSPSIRGHVQAACPVTHGVNMVSCSNWSRSLSVRITPAFYQGAYLLKLVGSGHQEAYILLTVWDPTSTAAYVLMARSLTEQGWNSFGGFDFYQGEGACAPGTPVYPVCNRARIVSFDRPYAAGEGASDFLANEYPLIAFMEEHGLDVAYVTDITVDEHPSILLDHRAVLSPGHDETWTYAEREGAQVALDHGVNIAFFGAAAVLRHARLQPSSLGPDRQEVDYREPDEDPLNGTASPFAVTGNTWSSPPTNWPETDFVGQVYSGYLEPGFAARPFVVWASSAWIFRGTKLNNGASIPGVIASDIDHIDPPEVPSDLEVLGHSPMVVPATYTNQGQWGDLTYSDMTYFTDPSSNGGVFDSGTVNWIDAMTPCGTSPSCPAPLVSKITGNLLLLFGQGPAGQRVRRERELESGDPGWIMSGPSAPCSSPQRPHSSPGPAPLAPPTRPTRRRSTTSVAAAGRMSTAP